MKELDWLLSEGEIKFIFEVARGNENYLRYAIQICALRNHGKFIKSYDTVEIDICNYLCKQMDLPAIEGLIGHSHRNSENRMRKHVCEFLGFTDIVPAALERWVKANTDIINDKKLLLHYVKEFLLKERFIAPSDNQLLRQINSVYAQIREAGYELICSKLNAKQLESLDGNEIYLLISKIRNPMAEANVKNCNIRINLLREIQDTGFDKLDLRAVSGEYIINLHNLAKNYDLSALRKIRPLSKRNAIIACHLFELNKLLIDTIIEANERLMGEILRRVNRDYDDQYNKLRRAVQHGQRFALKVMKKLVQQGEDVSAPVFCSKIGLEKINKAIADCEELENFDIYGKTILVKRRWSYLSNYMDEFLSLDLVAAKGYEDLIGAIQLFLSNCDDLCSNKFIEGPWKIYDKSKKIDKKAWKIGVFYAVTKAIKSGGLYLEHSKSHRDFWSPLCDKDHWDKNKFEYYRQFPVSASAVTAIATLRKEFNEEFKKAVKSFGPNNYANFKDGSLIVKKDEALVEPESTRLLREKVESLSPEIRIEDLLVAVQRETNYAKFFSPLPGYDAKVPLQLPILNAAITGHATNLGVSGICRSANNISADQIRHTSKWRINANNLKDASDIVILTQQKYWLTSLFGNAERSSSDGQRMKINKKSPIASMNPRYFGALDRGLTIYTHVSDQYSVFSTNVITCGVKEAMYILDGLLDNQIIINTHFTDNAGYTDIIFALMYLLGISFQPNFKDLKSQRLYCFDKSDIPTAYKSMFSTEKIDQENLAEQWDDILRMMYSLKKKLILPHILIKKLHNHHESSKLAKALIHLGRIVKTVYILRSLHDEDLRRNRRQQLNRGEERHGLGKYLFFADQGSFKTNSYEEIMNKASCLSFVSNAIVLYNTMNLQRIYTILMADGHEISWEDMARISPLSFKKLNVHGIYDFIKATIEANN